MLFRSRNLQQIKPINPEKSSNPHEKSQTQQQVNRSETHQSSHIKPYQATDPTIRYLHEQIRPPIKNKGGDTLGSRRERVHGEAIRASLAV